MTVRLRLGSCVALGLLASVAFPAASGLAAPRGPAGTPVTLTTAAGDADILSSPSTMPGVTIRYIVVAPGSAIQVACYVKGEAVHQDSTWYRVTAPAPGYIAGAQLSVPEKPATGVARCATPSYGHRTRSPTPGSRDQRGAG